MTLEEEFYKEIMPEGKNSYYLTGNGKILLMLCKAIDELNVTSLKIDEKNVKVLDMIAQDMRDDAVYFDGQPLTGKVVAEYFGNLGAAIEALAKIIKSLIRR